MKARAITLITLLSRYTNSDDCLSFLVLICDQNQRGKLIDHLDISFYLEYFMYTPALLFLEKLILLYQHL